MRLNEFFTEAQNKTAVFSFGRMNPPTIGHEKLIAAVGKIAASHGGDPFIFPTKTHDKKKNPLDFVTKVKFLRAFFPKANIVDDAAIRTVFEAIFWLGEQGYSNVIMVAGSDRVGTFDKMIKPYVPSINPDVDPEKALNIESFSTASAGERDPDSEGVEGASGTRAREFAINGQQEEFVNLIAPTSGTEQQKIALYNAVRVGLGIK